MEGGECINTGLATSSHW